MWKWERGRNYTKGRPYYKFTIYSFKWIRCDCHLILFPKGSSMGLHTDPIDIRYNHHRVNIVLRAATRGGQLFIGSNSLIRAGRFVYFKPDIQSHKVIEVIRGKRLVLSFGWLTKKRQYKMKQLEVLELMADNAGKNGNSITFMPFDALGQTGPQVRMFQK